MAAELPPATTPHDPSGTPHIKSAHRTVTLDQAVLRSIQELEEVGEPGLFAELLEVFRSEGSNRIDQLQVALARQDADQAFRLAHTLKGEALAWGATDLVDVTRAMEIQAQTGDLTGLTNAVPEVAALFAATLDALDAIRPQNT
jgi:HPt (histidine-containing phosphotransfer) domain-containing protein